MSDNSLNNLPGGFKGMSHDMGSDQTAFKGVQWGKVMMWIFLLSDTFIFTDAEKLGHDLAQTLLANGADKILRQVYDQQ